MKVRFEDLVGPKGGGTDEKQINTTKDIFRYLEIDGIDSHQIARKIFSETSVTFRKGMIGEYKKVLSTEQIYLFNKLHGDIIRQYGYELDDFDVQG